MGSCGVHTYYTPVFGRYAGTPYWSNLWFNRTDCLQNGAIPDRNSGLRIVSAFWWQRRVLAQPGSMCCTTGIAQFDSQKLKSHLPSFSYLPFCAALYHCPIQAIDPSGPAHPLDPPTCFYAADTNGCMQNYAHGKPFATHWIKVYPLDDLEVGSGKWVRQGMVLAFNKTLRFINKGFWRRAKLYFRNIHETRNALFLFLVQANCNIPNSLYRERTYFLTLQYGGSEVHQNSNSCLLINQT